MFNLFKRKKIPRLYYYTIWYSFIVKTNYIDIGHNGNVKVIAPHADDARRFFEQDNPHVTINMVTSDGTSV
jgi:hypothetical protein